MNTDALILKAYSLLGWTTINGSGVQVITEKVSRTIAESFIDDILGDWSDAVPLKKLQRIQFVDGTYLYSIPDDAIMILNVYPTEIYTLASVTYPNLSLETIAYNASFAVSDDLLEQILNTNVVDEFAHHRRTRGTDWDVLGTQIRLISRNWAPEFWVYYTADRDLASLPDRYLDTAGYGLAAKIAEAYISARESTSSTVKITGLPAGPNRDGLTNERIKSFRKKFEEKLLGLGKKALVGLG